MSPSRKRPHTIYPQNINKLYLDYYLNQAGGGGLPKFEGRQVQYGFGLGSFLRSMIRRTIPIGKSVVKALTPVAKEAFTVAQPHLKAAASDITKMAVNKVAEKLASKQNGGSRRKPQKQVKRKRPNQKRAPVRNTGRRTNHMTYRGIPDIF